MPQAIIANPEQPATLHADRPLRDIWPRFATASGRDGAVYVEVVPALPGEDRYKPGVFPAAAERPSASEALHAPHMSGAIGHAALSGCVRLASEVSSASWERARERNAQVAGQAALFLSQRGYESKRATRHSLVETLDQAAAGDALARKRIEADAISELAEMVCKSGSRMVAHAKMVDGHLTQFDKTTEERQLDALTTFTHQVPGLRDMANAEGQNAFMIEQLYRQGLLKEGKKVAEFSLIPNATREALKGSGLFLREAVAIIRTTEVDAEGNVTITSYLVGGTDQEQLSPITAETTEADEAMMEQTALMNRFDIQAFRLLMQGLGVPGAQNMSPTEMLKNPVYISDDAERATDGIDLAMAYDEYVSQIIGKPVMMGSASLYQKMAADGRKLSRADYEAHFVQVDALANDLQGAGREVAAQFIGRRREVGNSDYRAGRLMHRIAEKKAARYIAGRIADAVAGGQDLRHVTMPDTTVLGVRAHQALLEYERSLRLGDEQGAGRALRQAEETAVGTGCPSGAPNGSPLSANSAKTGEQDGRGHAGAASEIGGKPKGTKGPKNRKGKNKAPKKNPERRKAREILRCVHCPLCDRDGVDATVDYYSRKKVITCSGCRGHKEYAL